jgi:hypothetical protein
LCFWILISLNWAWRSDILCSILVFWYLSDSSSLRLIWYFTHNNYGICLVSCLSPFCNAITDIFSHMFLEMQSIRSMLLIVESFQVLNIDMIFLRDVIFYVFRRAKVYTKKKAFVNYFYWTISGEIDTKINRYYSVRMDKRETCMYDLIRVSSLMGWEFYYEIYSFQSCFKQNCQTWENVFWQSTYFYTICVWHCRASTEHIYQACIPLFFLLPVSFLMLKITGKE